MLTHAYATPTDWPLPSSCRQMKVCRGTTINPSTHHIDFGNHIDASNVNVHSHGHGGTCKPRWPATWFLRTSFIFSKSCPWAWGILPQIPPPLLTLIFFTSLFLFRKRARHCSRKCSMDNVHTCLCGRNSSSVYICRCLSMRIHTTHRTTGISLAWGNFIYCTKTPSSSFFPTALQWAGLTLWAS